MHLIFDENDQTLIVVYGDIVKTIDLSRPKNPTELGAANFFDVDVKELGFEPHKPDSILNYSGLAKRLAKT